MYVYADSTNRDTVLYPSGNSYSLYLTTPVRNISRVDLVSAKIPNAMYNLNNGINALTVSGHSNNIPNGFYSAYGIAETLTAHTGLQVSYLQNEGRLFFFSPTSFTLQILSAELQKMTGLVSTSVYTSNDISTSPIYYTGVAGYFVVSDVVIDLSTNEFVFLDIDELRTTQVIDSKALIGDTYSGNTIRSTFGMIPLDVQSGCIKTFKEDSDYVLSITYPQPIDKLYRLTVRWYDKTGALLNFNGFENNAFVLRLHETELVEEEPKQTSITEIELQRLIESLIPPPAPPKPEIKRIMVPRYLMYVILALLIAFGVYTYFKQVPIKSPANVLPQLPIKLPEPLRMPVAPRLI